MSSLFGSLDTTKLDKADVVDPSAATEDGKAADAKSTYEELTRISRMASDARVLAESKADKATTLAGYGITDAATKLELNSKADLVGGKVPTSQLPAFVDEVSEHDTMSDFPVTGESGKIYVAKDTNLTYRWSGTQYVEISPSIALGETASTAYPGDKGKAAAETAEAAYGVANNMTSAIVTHTENKSNPHSVTAEQVGAVPLVEDFSSEKTAVTIGSRIYGKEIGKRSLANGYEVIASGDFSHAEGDQTTASFNCSHAEGSITVASGASSHAEGLHTTASGDFSHAEGNYTTAAGKRSHAEGENTIASGTGSHTDGINSRTRSGDQFAFAWNGDERASQYTSHGPGTFNINPAGGLDGFYIGGQKLAMILSNKSDEITRFTWTSEDPDIPDGWIDLANSPSAPQPYFAGGYWSCGKIGGCEVVSLAQGTEDDLTFTLSFGDPTAEKVFSATATRKRVLRTGDAATPQELATKFDKTGGRIGPTDETGEQILPQTVVRIGRDATRNLGSGGKLAIASGSSSGGDVIVSAGSQDDVATLDVFGNIYENSGEIRVHKGFSAGTGNGNLLITHTGDGNETLTDRIRRDAGSLVSTNNPAFVSAVQNTPTSGMPEDTPTDWGAFGTVGAALAALAAGLKWCKNILGSLASGYSTFAAWIASKLDRASLLTEYSATSAYSVGAFVCHDGIIYQCKTAIADGGEAWNAEHWELRKLDDFFTNSNSLLTGTIDAEVISKGTAPDAHLEAPTDERLKLVLADNSVAYDSAKALPYKLTSVIGDRVVATMTLTAASTDITLPTIAANDTTVKDFILDVTNAYAVEGVATDAGINIPRTDFKLVTRDGESLTDVTTVKAGKSAFLCFTQKAPVVVGGTTYPCWCVIQLPFGDPS